MIEEPKLSELIQLEVELSNLKESDKLSDPLSIFLKNIGDFKLLTKDEEIELSRKISIAKNSKDESIVKIGREARDQMIVANLKLVVSIAKRYAYNSGDLMDLIQDGAMGLMKAVDRFEFDKGFRFSTYATWWIRQSITRALANNSRTIRLPVYIVDAISKVKKIKREYFDLFSFEPDVETISRISGLTQESINIIIQNTDNILSLDINYDNEEYTLGDMIRDKGDLTPDEKDKAKVLEDLINYCLSTLNERERNIIKLKYGFDSEEKSLQEIGDIYGISKERVRQIIKRAIEKIRLIYLGNSEEKSKKNNGEKI
jgi:RNA polymerase sigma factor (sigma-70 family)